MDLGADFEETMGGKETSLVPTNEVVLRDFDWAQDWRGILKILYDSWFFEDKPLIGYCGAAHFALHYLAHATNIVVATAKDGEMLGLLSLDNKVDSPVIARTNRFHAWQCAALERGASILMYLLPQAETPRLFSGLFAANYQKLRRLAPHAQWPEFSLLIVSPNAKRKGVGRKLVARGEDILRTQGYDHYYLLTDSSCDYKFYDRLQMTRVVDVAMSFNITHVPHYDYYLNSFLHCFVYEKDLQAPVALPDATQADPAATKKVPAATPEQVAVPATADPAPAAEPAPVAEPAVVKAEAKTATQTEVKAEQKAVAPQEAPQAEQAETVAEKASTKVSQKAQIASPAAPQTEAQVKATASKPHRKRTPRAHSAASKTTAPQATTAATKRHKASASSK